MKMSGYWGKGQWAKICGSGDDKRELVPFFFDFGQTENSIVG